MKHPHLSKFAPLALGLALVAGAATLSTPASAAPARNIAAAGTLPNDLVQNVQYRRHYYHHRHHRRSSRGGAVAAGVLGGLALGAMIGAATAAPPPPPPGYYARPYAADRDWLAYCSSKYRSFDPRSGTYLGYDGLRHPCQ